MRLACRSPTCLEASARASTVSYSVPPYASLDVNSDAIETPQYAAADKMCDDLATAVALVEWLLCRQAPYMPGGICQGVNGESQRIALWSSYSQLKLLLRCLSMLLLARCATTWLKSWQ